MASETLSKRDLLQTERHGKATVGEEECWLCNNNKWLAEKDSQPSGQSTVTGDNQSIHPSIDSVVSQQCQQKTENGINSRRQQMPMISDVKLPRIAGLEFRQSSDQRNREGERHCRQIKTEVEIESCPSQPVASVAQAKVQRGEK